MLVSARVIDSYGIIDSGKSWFKSVSQFLATSWVKTTCSSNTIASGDAVL